MIDVNRDLLGAPLGGDMLRACQRHPATIAGKPEEILRHQRYRAPRAPLPRRVSRRIDNNLTHDSPASMVRIAARNEKPRQRLGYPHSPGLGPVTVQVSQRGPHVPAALDRPGELLGSPSRPASFIIDLSTVLDETAALPTGLLRPASNHPRGRSQATRRLVAPRQARPLGAGRTRMRAVAGRSAGPGRSPLRKRSHKMPDPRKPSPPHATVGWSRDDEASERSSGPANADGGHDLDRQGHPGRAIAFAAIRAAHTLARADCSSRGNAVTVSSWTEQQ